MKITFEINDDNIHIIYEIIETMEDEYAKVSMWEQSNICCDLLKQLEEQLTNEI